MGAKQSAFAWKRDPRGAESPHIRRPLLPGEGLGDITFDIMCPQGLEAWPAHDKRAWVQQPHVPTYRGPEQRIGTDLRAVSLWQQTPPPRPFDEGKHAEPQAFWSEHPDLHAPDKRGLWEDNASHMKWSEYIECQHTTAGKLPPLFVDRYAARGKSEPHGGSPAYLHGAVPVKPTDPPDGAPRGRRPAQGERLPRRPGPKDDTRTEPLVVSVVRYEKYNRPPVHAPCEPRVRPDLPAH